MFHNLMFKLGYAEAAYRLVKTEGKAASTMMADFSVGKGTSYQQGIRAAIVDWIGQHRTLKADVLEVCNYLLDTERKSFEEYCLDVIDGADANGHIYEIAFDIKSKLVNGH